MTIRRFILVGVDLVAVRTVTLRHVVEIAEVIVMMMAVAHIVCLTNLKLSTY